MGKIAAVIVILALGLAIGVWLALGPRTPSGVGQSWDHVKTALQQLRADFDLKLHEAQLPSLQGGPSGPGLLDRITIPFADFASGMQRLWLNMGKSIRPAP